FPNENSPRSLYSPDLRSMYVFTIGTKTKNPRYGSKSLTTPTGQNDFLGRQINISVCCRSLYEMTNTAIDSTTSQSTRAVRGMVFANAPRLRASDFNACSATTAARSDILGYPISGEIETERVQHPGLRPAHV